MSDLVRQAAALREAQRMEEAYEAILAANSAAPHDPRAAFGLAQIAFETWRPAAALFAKAQHLLPGNRDIVRNHAMALAAEGDGAAAEALLEQALEQAPAWLDGHRILAAQRITAGAAQGFDRSYSAAVAKEPGNVALRMAWFQQHATLKNWDAAAAVLDAAQAAIPDNRQLQLARLFLDSESGIARNDAELFAGFETLGDPGLDLCRVRHHLRAGDPERAGAIATRHLAGPAARMFWPYYGLCCRLGFDGRDQTDEEAARIFATDIDLAPDEIGALAAVLRQLHRLRAPYPEQSVRGGTQTDRQMFFHPDPAIQDLRGRVSDAVRRYVDALPPRLAGDPLLGPARGGPTLFEGSWSVRLADNGFHSVHTHPKGWISSAFYLTLPETFAEPDGYAGWIEFGRPPPELDLSLEPFVRVRPKVGRLVLFPSTTWHGTVPFASGERLTVAFDIRIPPG